MRTLRSQLHSNLLPSHPSLNETLSYLTSEEKAKGGGEEELFLRRIRREGDRNLEWSLEHCHPEGNCGSALLGLCT